MSAGDWVAEARASYDAVAAGYAEQTRGALHDQPYLRAALGLLVEDVRAAGGGTVLDVGCGPGHVTAHLAGLGLDTLGIDVSPAMIDLARREHPAPRFEVASMTGLGLPAASVAGVLAWQSLIHVPDEEIPAVLGGFHRIMRPGAPLHLLFHVGETTHRLTEGYGGAMCVSSHRRRPERVVSWLAAAGFRTEAQLLLDPGGRRPGAVIFARRAEAAAGPDAPPEGGTPRRGQAG